jgi:hypothetical protein
VIPLLSILILARIIKNTSKPALDLCLVPLMKKHVHAFTNMKAFTNTAPALVKNHFYSGLNRHFLFNNDGPYRRTVVPGAPPPNRWRNEAARAARGGREALLSPWGHRPRRRPP